VIVSSRKQVDLDDVAAKLSREGECEPIVADLSTPEGSQLGHPQSQQSDGIVQAHRCPR
jgi:short-subunit dehydrogenase